MQPKKLKALKESAGRVISIAGPMPKTGKLEPVKPTYKKKPAKIKAKPIETFNYEPSMPRSKSF